MRFSKKSLPAALCLTMLFCCSPKPYQKVMVRPSSCSQVVQFAEAASMGHLLEFADLIQKPVFLYFYAPWIESCQRMDQRVFTNTELAYYFNNYFINYKINADGVQKDRELADRYGITTYPTLVFVDGKGKIMKRHIGPATSGQVLEMGYFLHNAVEKEMISMGTK